MSKGIHVPVIGVKRCYLWSRKIGFFLSFFPEKRDMRVRLSFYPCSAVLVHVGTVDGSTAQLRDA